MKPKPIAAILCLVLLAMCTTGVLRARACATVTPNPKDAVSVVNESAIIIWDAKHKREHFIRGATFKGAAREIGFLVPSPSVPELKAADHSVFEILEKALEPKVEHRTIQKIKWSLFDFGVAGSDGETAVTGAFKSDDGDDVTSVEVLQTQTVAGYDATTLKANDAGALNAWLHKNGYLAKADFQQWLAPYLQKGWVITAFKIRKTNKNKKQFSSSLVRMSFDAQKPFFPYSEPQNGTSKNSKTKRSLRIFFISDARYKAIPQSFGKFAAWPGKAVWSDAFTENDSSWIEGVTDYLSLPKTAIQESNWLTVFEDNSSPRPGTSDVYFERDKNEIKHLPPIVVVRWGQRKLCVEPLIFFGSAIFVLGGSWLMKRKRSA